MADKLVEQLDISGALTENSLFLVSDGQTVYKITNTNLGSQLLNLNATNVTSGVLNSARLSGTYNISISGGSASLTQPSVVVVNSASDALRITQAGAGNAFVVEDSASTDTTPFVIDATGTVVVGNTTRVVNGGFIQTHTLGTGVLNALYNWNTASAGAPILNFYKSESGTFNVTGSALTTLSRLGDILFYGSDGVDFQTGARIRVESDGGASSGSMPARITISTTPVSSVTPAEAIRIDSLQRVSFGGGAGAGESVRFVKNITGSVSSVGVISRGSIQSDVTTSAKYFNTFAVTQATAFTLAELMHFEAATQAFGAGSTVTTQYGYYARNSLTGATNNYGFYGNIAAGTGLYNFYANGTADNYFAGDVGIGVQSPSAKLDVSANTTEPAVRITQTGSGDVLRVEDSASTDNTPFVIDANGNVVSGFATPLTIGATTPKVQSQSNLPLLFHAAYFNNNTSGAAISLSKSKSGTVGTNALVGSGDVLGMVRFYGADGTDYIQGAEISAVVDGTPGTNNMPGRLVFSTTADGASTPTERIRITNAGYIGFGATPSAGQTLRIGTPVASGSTARGVLIVSQVQSAVTGDYWGFGSNPTLATGVTLGTLQHFRAVGVATAPSGDSLTNQYGFRVDSGMTGATNNYGFHSGIASGTGRWNFYAAGSAENYFAGRIRMTLTTDLGNMDGVVFSAASGGAAGHNVSLIRLNVDNAGPELRLGKANGSNITDGVVKNQVLGEVNFSGSDTVDLQESSRILAQAVGTWSTTSRPTIIRFATTNTGSIAQFDALRLTETGAIYRRQTAPINFTASATLTGENLTLGILTAAMGVASQVLTLPTGTNTELGTLSDVSTDSGFEWTIINTNATPFTIASNTGHSIVGNLTIAANTSSRFFTRKTATNVYVTYRLA